MRFVCERNFKKIVSSVLFEENHFNKIWCCATVVSQYPRLKMAEETFRMRTNRWGEKRFGQTILTTKVCETRQSENWNKISLLTKYFSANTMDFIMPVLKFATHKKLFKTQFWTQQWFLLQYQFKYDYRQTKHIMILTLAKLGVDWNAMCF